MPMRLSNSSFYLFAFRIDICVISLALYFFTTLRPLDVEPSAFEVPVSVVCWVVCWVAVVVVVVVLSTFAGRVDAFCVGRDAGADTPHDVRATMAISPNIFFILFLLSVS